MFATSAERTAHPRKLKAGTRKHDPDYIKRRFGAQTKQSAKVPPGAASNTASALKELWVCYRMTSALDEAG